MGREVSHLPRPAGRQLGIEDQPRATAGPGAVRVPGNSAGSQPVNTR